MREIKFRAWIKKDKLFYYNPIIDPQKDILYSEIPIDGACGNVWYEDDYELMQYSGLLDKNEKEIYELDIVKSWYRVFDDNEVTEHFGIVVFNSETASFTVNTFDYVAVLKGYRENSYQTMSNLYSQVSNDIEIIGNAYENPELLEETI